MFPSLSDKNTSNTQTISARHDNTQFTTQLYDYDLEYYSTIYYPVDVPKARFHNITISCCPIISAASAAGLGIGGHPSNTCCHRGTSLLASSRRSLVCRAQEKAHAIAQTKKDHCPKTTTTQKEYCL